MTINNTLASALSHILNCEKIGKIECIVKPSSNLILSTLKILKDHNYIGDFNVVNNKRGNLIKVNLIGNLNKCGVISPRFSATKDEFEKFEKRFLLAKDFGLLIVSTPQGLMTHKDAITKGLGGRLISYCY